MTDILVPLMYQSLKFSDFPSYFVSGLCNVFIISFSSEESATRSGAATREERPSPDRGAHCCDGNILHRVR